MGRVLGLGVGVAAFHELRPMNEIQTAEFAIGCSVAVVILLLGAACCEIYRALLKEREEVERLRKLYSENHHHRMTMECAIEAYCHSLGYEISETEGAYKAMLSACTSSKSAHD